MAQRSQNERLKEELRGYYAGLVRGGRRAADAMYAAEAQKRNPNSVVNMYQLNTDSYENKFRQILQRLYTEYAYKFEKRNDVEVPDDLREKLGMGENPHEGDIFDLEWEECKQLLWKIKELQERLGHTSLETNEYTEVGYGNTKED